MVSPAIAQTFGVKAGASMTTLTYKDEAYTVDYKFVPGFTIGGMIELPLTGGIRLESGLQITSKGATSMEDGSFADLKETIRLYYLEVPITAKASFTIGNSTVYGLFGPYLGVGLSGKSTLRETINGDTNVYKDDITWGNATANDYKRGDLGLVIGGGIMVNQFQIGLSYHTGLSNISAQKVNGRVVKNQVIGLSVGYWLQPNE